ncbi:hypothetical protein [Marinobacter alkaliphilus]|uniref:hypothetical protein n=1 Tax=Marinobacter alkaliphilus TaxID=254719 RepID=UPI003D80B43C|nr:hypothetical protein PBN92_11720 [Marinobacter alkaliphilus]
MRTFLNVFQIGCRVTLVILPTGVCVKLTTRTCRLALRANCIALFVNYMNDFVEISKMDAARRQLTVAIELYFRGFDAISIHTLSAAARNVLDNLCSHRGVKVPIRLESMLNEMIKPEHQKNVRNKFRKSENFFKHADKDPDGTLRFNPISTEYTILEAVESYAALSNELPPMLLAFRTWWMLHNQDLLNDASNQFSEMLKAIQYERHDRMGFLKDFMVARYAAFS